MIQCEGQIKLECAMTFQEKMESKGWHNVYDREPDTPGTYRIYKGNGTTGKAFYVGNHIWKYSGGWEFCWWKEL